MHLCRKALHLFFYKHSSKSVSLRLCLFFADFRVKTMLMVCLFLPVKIDICKIKLKIFAIFLELLLIIENIARSAQNFWLFIKTMPKFKTHSCQNANFSLAIMLTVCLFFRKNPGYMLIKVMLNKKKVYWLILDKWTELVAFISNNIYLLF